MQHSADFKKFTVRINGRLYEFPDELSTRTANRALEYMMKLRQGELAALREELAPRNPSAAGEGAKDKL